MLATIIYSTDHKFSRYPDKHSLFYNYSHLLCTVHNTVTPWLLHIYVGNGRGGRHVGMVGTSAHAMWLPSSNTQCLPVGHFILHLFGGGF